MTEVKSAEQLNQSNENNDIKRHKSHKIKIQRVINDKNVNAKVTHGQCISSVARQLISKEGMFLSLSMGD
jgi:hypothetical protein